LDLRAGAADAEFGKPPAIPVPPNLAF